MCTDDNFKTKLMNYQLLIETLAYSTIGSKEPPAGCAIVTVTDKVQVHLLLKVTILWGTLGKLLSNRNHK